MNLTASQKVCFKLPLFCYVQSLQFGHAIPNDKLEVICKTVDLFHLLPSRSNKLYTTSIAADGHSFLIESDVVGLEIRDANRRLVESLISRVNKGVTFSLLLAWEVLGILHIQSSTLLELCLMYGFK
ncbi:hypothetical protein J5N97_013594 [Dioscorea zingiberensis]|uniref:Uncharacterized protein n=1 Tax=Dioscorea zingiberensis TaxID=325984 RepID=A0A9D5HIS7_9LILI|nr:hypothetical protein J5N97_013594 [Dioscorea zingiberensis]